MTPPLLEVRHLSVCYEADSGALRAVTDMSFQMSSGEVLALVGETGCGKSTVALALMGLTGAGRIESGEILFDGRDLRLLPEPEMRRMRGSEIGIVFQETRSALNPVVTVGDLLVETIRAHNPLSRRQARALAAEVLCEVGIAEPLFEMRKYPFELSGGLCQRVGVALGICNKPRFLIADEPTSALDPTIQAQIMRLLADMRRRYSLSLLLISHDLALVSESADRVAVMYHSRLVECGPVCEVLENPAHPYTRALREAVPDMDHQHDSRPLAAVPGAAPAPGERLPGCPFAPRCDRREQRCTQGFPPATTVSDGHWAACVNLAD